MYKYLEKYFFLRFDFSKKKKIKITIESKVNFHITKWKGRSYEEREREKKIS